MGRRGLKREVRNVDRRIAAGQQLARGTAGDLSAHALRFLRSPAGIPVAVAAGFVAERLRHPALRLSGSLLAAVPAMLRLRYTFRQLQNLIR